MMLTDIQGALGATAASGAQEYQMPPYFILLLIGMILFFQLRERKVRPIKLLIPLIFMVPLTLLLASYEISVNYFNVVILVLGFIIGCGIGYAVTRMSSLRMDDSGNVLVKGSIPGTAIWIVFIVVKLYGNDLLQGAHMIDLGLLTSFFLTLSLGTILVRRIILFVKYREMRSGTGTAGTGEVKV